ncbi:MAG TPA: hemolysin XhlA family protein, partial [Tissierellaceae bacterium]|nr:hemolysin XhlA family protein [Tissierellaceae bacterium]
KINYRLDTQETRINKHSERLDLIENGYNRLDERLSNLIEKLESLNVTLKWFMGMILGGIVGFFFYAIQSGLLGR